MSGDSGTSGVGTRRFEIEGRSLGFPSRYPDASSAVGLFSVPSAPAQRLIAGTGFEVAELLPGRAALSLACVHYRESDCGAYDEIALGFFVVPRHRRPSRIPFLGTWLDILRSDAALTVWMLPVTTVLANDAGVRMWGFPKTVEEIDFEEKGGRAVFRWRRGGREVLSYSVAATGNRRPPPSASAVYSIYEGAPHVTILENESRQMGARLGGGRLHLGDHPVADDLRSLGLPRRPIVSTWMGHVAFTAGPPQPLASVG